MFNTALVRERLGLQEAQLAAADREVKHKDQIIAARRQRLFGSRFERINPDQYQLDFGEEILGIGTQWK